MFLTTASADWASASDRHGNLATPRAAYAILHIEPELFQVRHYRLEYDVARAVAAIRKHELPEAFAQMMLQGHNLDAVQQNSVA